VAGQPVKLRRDGEAGGCGATGRALDCGIAQHPAAERLPFPTRDKPQLPHLYVCIASFAGTKNNSDRLLVELIHCLAFVATALCSIVFVSFPSFPSTLGMAMRSSCNRRATHILDRFSLPGMCTPLSDLGCQTSIRGWLKQGQVIEFVIIIIIDNHKPSYVWVFFQPGCYFVSTRPPQHVGRRR
jgi:hypothetical protein